MTETERRIYEASIIPLAMYTKKDGMVVAELVSDAFCRMMHMDRATLIALLDNRMLERVHPEDAGRMVNVIERFAKRECGYDIVYRSKHAENGVYREIHAVGGWQKLEDGAEVALIYYTDISDSLNRIASQREDYELFQQDRFYTDEVTGIPNLNYVKLFSNEKANQLRMENKTPALIYFDIRSMHAYNNGYGYTRGNELLRLVANELRAAFPDALLGRGTDDHFILVDEYSEEIGKKAVAVNERVRSVAYGKTAGIQCAIVQMSPAMKTVEALDGARNVIKEIGDDINIVYRYYSQQLDDEFWMRRYIFQNFENALMNRWIRVHYQPILRTQTRKTTILEALARWVDPVQGTIKPNVFIPVLTRYHLMYKLDLYMVEQVCREFGERKAAGLPPVPVSVNFSAQDFDYVDVVSELNRLVAQYGLSRQDIIVEITEQEIAQATEYFKTQLHRIHEDGYRLWIDDFGSGYSSLNVFGQYQVDRIKFDMELLRHLDDNNGANRVILRSIVDMCRRIGVHTLAEGVETEAQYRFLREIDCEMMQGFRFSKPHPLESSVFRARETGNIPAAEDSEERSRLCREWLKNSAGTAEK